MANKKNFMKRSKYNFKKGEDFQTVFHLGLSSKAIFSLSEQALKLYIMFVLHGKKNPPSIKLFAARMKKSERTISRLYEELKELGFLKIDCVKPKVYKYTFDSNGNVNYKAPVETVRELGEEKQKETEEVVYKESPKPKIKENVVIEKSKTIKEYEDFAVLENIFWELNGNEREEIINIMEERYKRELESREVLDWFLKKVKYV